MSSPTIEPRFLASLGESEMALWGRVVQSLGDYSIFLVDTQGRIVSWNDGARRAYGYEPQEMLGQHVGVLYGSQERAGGLVEREMKAALESGGYTGESRRVRKDGSAFWASSTITPLRGEDGRHIGFLRITRDVSQRRAAEEGLRASEERFRRLVDGVRDYAIYMLDTGGRIATWNAGAELSTGYSESDVLGQPFSLFFPADEVASSKPERVLETAQRDGRHEQEGWRLRKDGTRFFASVVVTALADERGEPGGFSVITRDTTERRRSRELLRSVLDNAIDGIIGIDERGTIFTFNHAAERIFGYPADEVIGRNVKLLMPEPYQSEHDGYLVNYLRTGIAKIIGIGREVEGRRKSGQIFPLELALTDFSLDRTRHFIGMCRDLSERKKLEEQLRQSQKMEAVGQLAGGIAHDFNNLLTVIAGHSEVLLGGMTPGDSNQESVSAIRDAGERASALTRQLLAFSRKQVLAPRVLDLNENVIRVERLLRRLIGEDILLTTVLDPRLHKVRVDPGQLDQVLVNLAVNARDAMSEGGRLTIETRNIDLDDEYCRIIGDCKPGHYVRISVTDTGCGMPPEVRSRIFEPFFTTKGPGRGTGLGLATVYGIVKQSGGHVSVYSEVDVGTTFKIYLPAAPEALSPTAAETAPRTTPRGHETILLVEDDDGVRGIARMGLEKAGYRVLVAGGAAEALKLVDQEPIHLLLTDVVMPDMSGRVLAERIQQKRPGIRTLFMSGYTDDAVVRHGIVEMNQAFLQKPFTPLGLCRRVREVLEAPPPER